MRRYFRILSLFLTILICASSALAQEIAVLKSLDIKPYDDVVKGFKSVCCDSRVREYVISTPDGSREIERIRKRRPDLILAIGMNALAQSRDIKDTPIIYAMVFDPEAVIDGQDNVTGVSMRISPEEQLLALREVLPDVERVGLVYDPQESAHLFEEAKSVASEFGIKIIAKEVRDPKEVPLAIRELKLEIDAYWMLPDMTVITRETVEYLFLFSFENDIPILSFSDKYVELGALMALHIDVKDIGAQAGEMAKEILSGADSGDIPMSMPRKTDLFINLRTAKKFGIAIDKEIIQKSNIVK